ncbi:hypothetical protein RRG08_039336 [Elysia crispata]|uniref:Methyltransferase n=1 Tax=Elysia crispata TaxID=231223 RepID=A0AAE1D2W9_9GAST|nr:hypothetical protein RRG08_039336 [Elysia crispata]
MDTALLFQSSHLAPGNVDKSKMFSGMDHSKTYAEHRPRYTDELFKTIADYCKETNPDLNLAVDVGCGPGMSTIGFAQYLKKVRWFPYTLISVLIVINQLNSSFFLHYFALSRRR